MLSPGSSISTSCSWRYRPTRLTRVSETSLDRPSSSILSAGAVKEFRTSDSDWVNCNETPTRVRQPGQHGCVAIAYLWTCRGSRGKDDFDLSVIPLMPKEVILSTEYHELNTDYPLPGSFPAPSLLYRFTVIIYLCEGRRL